MHRCTRVRKRTSKQDRNRNYDHQPGRLPELRDATHREKTTTAPPLNQEWRSIKTGR